MTVTIWLYSNFINSSSSSSFYL